MPSFSTKERLQRGMMIIALDQEHSDYRSKICVQRVVSWEISDLELQEADLHVEEIRKKAGL